MKKQIGVVAFALSAIGPDCAQAGTQDQVILEWNERLAQTIRETNGIPSGFPGPVSRCIAIVFTSVHDAVNSVSPKYEPYLDLVPCPPGTSAEAAAASAAYHAMSLAYQFTPLQQPHFDALYAEQLARIPDGDPKSNGIVLGQSCANAIYSQRLNDGSDADKSYTPILEPGHWRPTWPDGTAAASPHWGSVTPWCMTSNDQFLPEGSCGGFFDMPTLLLSPEYTAQYNEVKELGRLDSQTRTEYETETAFFWANDRGGTYKPPGHLLHIAQVLSEDHNLSLHEQARLFALAAVGMADAGIASWSTKYDTGIDLWRPITAVWEAATDGNPATEPDQTWLALSYHPSYASQGGFTPPFPAWVSGHATFGAVTSAVYRNFFGTDNVTFTITSDDTPGLYRTYNSFTAAALENGRSRVFFGVHYQWDADGGFEVGNAIGDYIAENFFRKLGDINGDGVVDVDDLLVIINNWGNKGGGDLNDDGIVDVDDLLIVLNGWGN